MDALSRILQRLQLRAEILAHVAYCGHWAVDTSGKRMASFHLIQRGNCWLHVEGRAPQLLNAGDFVLFPHDSPHIVSSGPEITEDIVVNRPEPDQEGPATQMLCGYFEFQSRAMWPLLDGLSPVVVIDLASSMELGDTQRLLQLIIHELSVEQPGNKEVIDKLAYVLFVHVLRSEMRRGQTAGLLAALNDPKVGQALNLIHFDPSAPWSLEQLARKVGISRSSFAERFRDLVGESPMRYLTAWRMQQAVDLLTQGDLSVSAVAEACGYQSEVAFRKAFRSVVGKTPGEVRQSA